MENKNTSAQPDFFSNDPEENLRIENEILHLKLKAELGGDLVGNLPLPPDLENEFMKNILEFEHAFAKTKQVKIFDFLGKPSFLESDHLDDRQVEVALSDICDLMASKNIVLDFSGQYDPRLKYKFITEELFERETDDIEIPGLVTHFIYEEFHPNHKFDIESRAVEFIQAWFKLQVDEDNWELGDSFLLPDEKVFSKKEVVEKIKTVLESYKEFNNTTYSFINLHFETEPDNSKGMGVAEGFVSYDAILESGEKVFIEGPFRIYFSLEYQWWSIYYFVIPGFKW